MSFENFFTQYNTTVTIDVNNGEGGVYILGEITSVTPETTTLNTITFSGNNRFSSVSGKTGGAEPDRLTVVATVVLKEVQDVLNEAHKLLLPLVVTVSNDNGDVMTLDNGKMERPVMQTSVDEANADKFELVFIGNLKNPKLA